MTVSYEPRFEPERLREALRESGLSQHQVAVTIGTTSNAVTYWVTGKRIPSADNLMRLSKALDRFPEWFFGEDPDEDDGSANAA